MKWIAPESSQFRELFPESTDGDVEVRDISGIIGKSKLVERMSECFSGIIWFGQGLI